MSIEKRPSPSNHIADLKKYAFKIVDRANDSEKLARMPAMAITRTGLTRGDICEKLDKVRYCADLMEIRTYRDSIEKIHHANFCRQPSICPVCSSRLQGKRRAILEPEIRTAALNHKHAYMMTFTIESGPDLFDQIAKLKRAIRKMRQKGQLRSFGRSFGELGKVKAGLVTTEIKVGNIPGDYHVHAHALVFTDKELDFQVYDQHEKSELNKKYGYGKIPSDELLKAALMVVDGVPMSKLSREWYSVSGAFNLDCRKIRRVPQNASEEQARAYSEMTFDESVFMQSKEVTKYITKFSDGEDVTFGSPQGDMVIDIMAECMGRVRHYSTMGEFRARFHGPDDYTDGDDSHLSAKMFRFNREIGSYEEAPTIQGVEPSDYAKFMARSDSAKALSAWRVLRRKIGDASVAVGADIASLLNDLKAGRNAFSSLVKAAYQAARRYSDIPDQRREEIRAMLLHGQQVALLL